MLKKLCVPALFAAAAVSAFAQERDPARPATPNPEANRQNRDNPDATRPNADPNRPATEANRPTDGARDAHGAAAQEDKIDGHVATCFLLANQEEVALAKWAQQRTQNEKVKQFTQMLIDDHSKMIGELQKFASDPSIQLQSAEIASARPDGNRTEATRPDANRQPGATPNNATDSTRTAARPDLARGAGGHNEMLAMAKDAHQECLRLTQEELGKKQGAEFDHCFVGSQIGMHIGMLAHLKAAEPRVSGELQALIQKARQSASKHKEQANQLAEELKNAQASAGSAPRTTAPRPATGTATERERTTDQPATRPAQPGTTTPATTPPGNARQPE